VKIKSFFGPRERFLVLEITPKGTNGLFLNVDDDRNVVFEKIVRNADLARLVKSPVRRLSEKTWEGKKFFGGRRRVVAAADPSLATTIPVPLELAREPESVKTAMTLAELENLIAQGMAKIFNGCRAEAAKRLAVSDLDALLVAARAEHFKMDGRVFISPVGVRGKKITLVLELIFTTRAVFEALSPFFNAPEGFFFAEAPQAYLQATARVRALPLNLIVLNEGGASLYVLTKPKGEHPVLYREKLAWSFQAFMEKIIKAFAISEAAARELYCLYHRGEMSEHAARTFRKTVEPALISFFKELERGGVKGPVYMDMAHALPVTLPHRHGKATLEEHPVNELAAELGFTLPDGWLGDEGRNDALRPLLYFLEAYFDRNNSEINQKLRRRLHWLVG
jgi:hypothetical protein